MPTPDALARETRVLELACSALSSGDRQVSIRARPDGDTTREWPITVDAVLEVQFRNEQRMWAADVCTVGFHPQVPSAVRGLEARLTQALIPLAEMYGRAMHVTRTARIRSNNTDPGTFAAELEAETASVATHAEDALKSGPGFYPFPDGDGAVRVVDQVRLPDGALLRIGVWLNATPGISEQLKQDLAPVVRKKLRGQFLVARLQGMPTVLILDQGGAPDLVVGTNFLATAFSIAPVVQECMDQQIPPALDAVVLVDPHDNVQEIIGAVGMAMLDQP